MLKNIKIYSVVVLTTLVMLGCGASDDGKKSKEPDAKKEKFANYSDAEKLAYAIVNQKKATSKKDSGKSSRGYSENCSVSGTMEMIGDISSSPTMEFKNCNNGTETITGKMKINISSDSEGDITYVSDFTVKDGEDDIFIKKGGHVSIHEEGEWEVSVINLEMSINGITHGGENLIYRAKELQDGSLLEYPVSGKEKIGDNAYFIVDANYNAEMTPFKTDKDDHLQSGLFKYIDKNSHAVELEITTQDVVTVRVDSDGNGVFEGSEISSISL